MSLSHLSLAKHNCYQVYDAQQVLANEAKVAINNSVSMYQLMERAGEAAFTQLKSHWPKAQSILILSGKGNNGGDGFIIARLAHQAGLKVRVILTCSANLIIKDAQTAYQAMITCGLKPELIDDIAGQINDFKGDVIVDALFGIGFHGNLADEAENWVNSINQNKAAVLSVDIPSGLCATTGFVTNKSAVIADVTVTFIVYKQGVFTGQAANFVGTVILADLALGLSFEQQVTSHVLLQKQILSLIHSSPLKKRWQTSHKGSIGQILSIGGDLGYPGAIRLASEAALRAGAGLVAVCCYPENHSLVFHGRPELMFAPSDAQTLESSMSMGKSKVLLLGPGLGQRPWSQKLFNLVMAQTKLPDYSKAMVIDADALTLLANEPHYYKHWVLTPHPKEAAKLLNCTVENIERNRFNAVKAIANKYGGICVLKGAGSLISDGEQVMINSTGNAGMASGGMGDVLSGTVAAYILQAEHYFAAVCLAVYIHGAAGDIIANEQGQRGMLASDLFKPLQQLTNQV